MNQFELKKLIERLVKLPNETEWLEFKCNYSEPVEIGQYISALSNSAALNGKKAGYIIWGIEDESHDITGTGFRPYLTKGKGNENLQNWLIRHLKPQIDIKIYEENIPQHIVIFEIEPAIHSPISFMGEEYIRIGNYKKKLKNHPEKERQLWSLFESMIFEDNIVSSFVSSDDILDLIDYPSYFKLMEQHLPVNRQAILDRLQSEKIILRVDAKDHYDITNIGAILFASNLNQFERLSRKAPRVVIYRSDNRIDTIKEQIGVKGYAIGFEGLVSYIIDQLPQNEQIGRAFRKSVCMYPEIAIRELVANALIHQDFSRRGSGPLIEIFDNRMEITNPGVPLIHTLRFIDEPPQSRNEKLASYMRRMNICEERGSGIDKVIFNVEAFQLPAPDFRATEKSTVAILYGPRKFSEMDREDRIRACYQHVCLCHVSGKHMTNTSLRERLKIENPTLASKIISDAVDVGLIKPYSAQSSSRKYAKYVPFWA